MKIKSIQNFIDVIRRKNRAKNKWKIDCNSLFDEMQIPHQNNLSVIRKKAQQGEKINIAILAYASAPSVDNFSRLYRLLITEPFFNVHMVIAPYTHDNVSNMLDRIRLAEGFLTKQKILFIRGVNQEGDRFFNVNEELKPDLVFAESNYDWNHDFFLPSAFPRSLYYFIPYSPFLSDNMKHHFKQKVMVQAYKLFPAIRSDLQMFEDHSPLKSKNIHNALLGSLKLEPFFDPVYAAKPVWKKCNAHLKKLIWAPHHSWAWYGQFLHYHQFMLDTAIKYKGKLQIAFKPHPALKESLREVNGWSHNEVIEYYNAWAGLENGQTEDGEWVDLFMGSDAMLMDSISFMAEYMATGKPACFLTEYGSTGKARFNKAGAKVFKNLYHAGNEEQIHEFIENVLIEGNDPLYARRLAYIDSDLRSDNGQPASLNYLNYIKQTLLS